MSRFPMSYVGPQASDGRQHVKQEIIGHLFPSSHQPSSFVQPSVLLCNALGENYSTGKTAIASTIAQHSLDEEDYDLVLWIQDPEMSFSNLDIFYQYLIKKLKKFHSLTYQFPDIHQLRAESSHYYENAVLDLLAFNRLTKYLLIIDNLSDFTILPAIKLLGIPSLITSRYRPVQFDGCIVEISRFTENGIDILSPLPQRYSPPEWSLISAYLLGASQQEDLTSSSHGKLIHKSQSAYEPTLPLMLHAHLYCSISPIAARLYSVLRFLPVNIFVPTQLIVFVLKLWLGNGQEREIMDELIRYSFLQSSLDGDSVLITKDSKAVLDVFCLPHHMSHKNDLHSTLPLLEDIIDRLAVALSSVSSFILLELNSHTNCIIPLFEFLQWTPSDIFLKFNPILETFLITQDLITAERFLKTLYEAFDGTPLTPQLSEIGSLEARDKILFWIMKWSRQFVEKILLLPLDFSSVEYFHNVCSLIQFHATICQICHYGDESIAMRQKLVEYSRPADNSAAMLGVALLSLGRSIFLAQTSGSGQIYQRAQNSVNNVLNSVARTAVKALAKADSITSLGDCSLVFLVDVLELGGNDYREAIGILETVLKLRYKFHETQLHPRVSIIYCRISQIYARESDWTSAFQSLIKSIRINRTLFGEDHYMTSQLVLMLSDFHKALGDHEMSQDLSIVLREISSIPHLTSFIAREKYGKVRSSPTLIRKKIAKGGNLDDVALLIALAEKIMKKRDYFKSRKYLVKALQLIKDIMADSNDVELYDPALPLVFKWSAFHKLGELNVVEGEPLRAIKFYHRSYKGFLELAVMDNEHEVQHLAEALTVLYHLGTLIESVKGFHEAFRNYFELLMIMSDIFLSSKLRLSQPLEVHVSIMDHLYRVLFHHQRETMDLINRLSSTLYQSSNNLFDLRALKSDLPSSTHTFWNNFLKLRKEVYGIIPFPNEIPVVENQHFNSNTENQELSAIELCTNASSDYREVPDPLNVTIGPALADPVDLGNQLKNEPLVDYREVPNTLNVTIGPALADPVDLGNQPKNALVVDTLSSITSASSLPNPASIFPVASSISTKEIIPLPPKPPVRVKNVKSPTLSPVGTTPSLLRSAGKNRRGPRAIHILPEDISESLLVPIVTLVPDSSQIAPQEGTFEISIESPKPEELLPLCGHSASPTSPTNAPLNISDLDNPTLRSPSNSSTNGTGEESVPQSISRHHPSSLSTPDIHSNVENLPIQFSSASTPEFPSHEVARTTPEKELPPQPRLSKKVSIKEIQEECTKFINFFVFGSLRRHQENHSLLAMPNRDESFSYLGTTTTVHRLYLYIHSLTGLPIVTEEPISSKSTPTTVVGEVYSVTPSIVERAAALFPDSTLVNIELESFGGAAEDNVAVMYLAIEPSSEEWINIPRGNYSQFLSARGGLEAFIAESSMKNRRKSINTADLEKMAESFKESKNPKQKRKYKIWD